MLKRAHVVQPIGKFDQQYAYIGRDRQQQLAQILCLRRPARNQIESLDLGQSLDELTNVLAEHLVDLAARCVGVLDRIVQQRDGDGCIVELEIGKDSGHFQRVRKVRIAIGTLLRAMLLHGIYVGLVQQAFVRIRIVAHHPLDQLVLTHHDVQIPRKRNAAEGDA